MTSNRGAGAVVRKNGLVWMNMTGNEWVDMNEARTFMRSIGRARLLITDKPEGRNFWIGTLIKLMRRSRVRASRAIIKRLALQVADDLVLRAAFETVARLDDGGAGLTKWIVAREAPPPMTKAEALTARIEGRRKKSTKDEKHARKMLTDWTRVQARAKTAVKKWKAKVAYYDRKAVTDDE